MKRRTKLLASLCLSAMVMTFLFGTQEKFFPAEAIVVSEYDPEAKEGRPAYSPSDEYYETKQNISMDHVGDIESVWDNFKGDGIRVAVIDSGFDLDNPDFIDEQGNSMFSISEGRMFAHATAVTGQNATYTMDKTGATSSGPVVQFAPQAKNVGYKINDVWYYGDSILRPWAGYSKYSKHGTDVCSTLASRAHDTTHTGTIGIAPKVTIIPIKVDFWTDSIWNALYYIRYTLNANSSTKVDVVNMSIEAPYDANVNTYVSSVVNSGTIVVAAAGNDNISTASYPASSPKAIGVGALDRNSSTAKASFSNYNAPGSTKTGNNNVDLVAPGYVYTASWNSSTSGHTYSETQGTSFSSPIVAGAAALWKQAHPSGTVDEFKTDLWKSCVDIGTSGWDTTFGYGRLDIKTLIGYVPVTGIEVTPSSVSLNLDNHETATLTATVSPSNATNKEFTWESSNTNVATVNNSGVVTPKKVGTCQISAITEEGKFDDYCNVTVTGSTSTYFTIGWGNASGDTGTYKNFTDVSGSQTGLLSFATQANSSSNPPAYNSNSKHLRIYYASNQNGGSITITPHESVTIHGFELLYDDNLKPTIGYQIGSGDMISLTASGSSYSATGFEAIKTSPLKIQNINSSSVQLRIRTLKLFYSQAPYVTSIEVQTPPDNVNYQSGDTFDPTGLVIKRNYSDSSFDTLSYTGHSSQFTFTPDLNTPLCLSDTSVKIYQGDFSTTQSITVTKAPVTGITAVANKTFSVGETINKSNITVTDNNGDVVTDYEFNSYQFVYGDALSGGSLTDKIFDIQYGVLSTSLTAKVQRTAYESTTGDRDILTRETTGVTDGSSTYTSWSGKTSKSSAVYAGKSAGVNNSIQIRSKESDSGIVSTSSGGKIKKVTVEWQSSTSNGRTLNVYGNSKAYSAPSELFNSSTQGTLLGTIVKGASTELTIDGSYSFVGVRSAGDAMYLTSITFSYGGDETPTNVANYIMFEDNEGQCADVGTTKGKFSIACNYFGALTKQGRATFMESTEYVISTARERFIKWAAYHHKTIKQSGDDYIITPSIQNRILMDITSNSPSIIVIVASIICLSALGGYIYIRMRKER